MNKIFQTLKKRALKEPILIRSSRHAAAIVYKDRILSIGTNKRKTHPLQAEYGCNAESIYLHAEIDALIRYINKYGTSSLKECELHVLRVNKKGLIASSEPCLGCKRAIKAFGIKKVYYT